MVAVGQQNRCCDGEIASSERTFDEEEELIKQEAVDNPIQSPLAQAQQTQDQQAQISAADNSRGTGQGANASPRAINGSGNPLPPVSPFVETGDGLVVKRAGAKQ